MGWRAGACAGPALRRGLVLESDGFHEGPDELALLVVAKEEPETGAGSLAVSDGGVEGEDAVRRLEAEEAVGALTEWEGEAGEETVVAQVDTKTWGCGGGVKPETDQRGCAGAVDEFDGEVAVEAREPVEEPIDVRHGGSLLQRRYVRRRGDGVQPSREGCGEGSIERVRG